MWKEMIVHLSKTKKTGVSMTDNDLKFYKRQKSNPPTGYCKGYVDQKWKLYQEYKQEWAKRTNLMIKISLQILRVVKQNQA